MVVLLVVLLIVGFFQLLIVADEYNIVMGLIVVGVFLVFYGVDLVVFIDIENCILGIVKFIVVYDGVVYYFLFQDNVEKFEKNFFWY